MRKGFKIFLLLVVVASMLLSFVACNTPKPSDSTSGSAQSSSAAPAKDVTLKVMICNTWNTDAMKDVFTRFQATGIKLDIQVLPDGAKLNEVIAAKAATQELTDIVFTYGMSAFLTQINAEVNLMDLSKEAYISKIVKSITAQNAWLKLNKKYYVIPAGAINAGGVIYSKKVFTDLGITIPTTYDQLLAACEKIKAAGITPIYEAGKDGWPLQVFNLNLFADMIQAKQPDIFTKLNDNTLKMAQIPEFVKMFEMQKALNTKGYINKDFLSGTYDASLAAVANGTAAMTINADWAMPTMASTYPAAQIGMFAMPYDGNNIVPISDPWAVGIASNTKYPTEAKKFLEFFTSSENLNTYYGALKSIPCYSGVTASLNPGTVEMAKLVDEGKAVPMWNGLINPAYKDLIKVIQDVYVGAKTPAQAAAEIDAQRAELGKAQQVKGWN